MEGHEDTNIFLRGVYKSELEIILDEEVLDFLHEYEFYDKIKEYEKHLNYGRYLLKWKKDY